MSAADFIWLPKSHTNEYIVDTYLHFHQHDNQGPDVQNQRHC